MNRVGWFITVMAFVSLIDRTSLALAESRFATFFLAVGNSDYLTPPSDLHGFDNLPGANESAQTVADILARNGAVAGITLTSDEGKYVSKSDIELALADLIKRMQASHSANPILVVYLVGHGISEGVAWNHFSVPGNFAYRHPLERLDVDEMARHTINAALLADKLEKTAVPYLILLDTCYSGQPASFASPVLTPAAISSLQQVAGILRFTNEFHDPDPVIFSAEPGHEVDLAPDPRSPKQASLGPLGRRFLLLATQMAANGGSLRISEVVARLTSPQLDKATSPPVTHAKAPRVDGVLLSPTTKSASVESRTGTATAADVCCEPMAGASGGAPATKERHLKGSLTLQGGAGEFFTGGRRVALPQNSTVTISEPDRASIELSFALNDDWELDLAAPRGRELAPGTYRKAKRYSFQQPAEAGLALTGAGKACNDVVGEFTVTRLRRDAGGRVQELAATFTQRCDDLTAVLSGSVSIGGP